VPAAPDRPDVRAPLSLLRVRWNRGQRSRLPFPVGYSDVRVGSSAWGGGPCPSGVVAVGTPCMARSECGVSQVCAFSVTAGCAAQGSCQSEPEPVSSGCSQSGPHYCGCGPVAIWEITECNAPPGTALSPVAGPAPDTGCAAPDAEADLIAGPNR
jgi:hypothetical protein